MKPHCGCWTIPQSSVLPFGGASAATIRPSPGLEREQLQRSPALIQDDKLPSRQIMPQPAPFGTIGVRSVV